jgi:hypothetical protein
MFLGTLGNHITIIVTKRFGKLKLFELLLFELILFYPKLLEQKQTNYFRTKYGTGQ